jgi:hypothetical protein
MGYGCPDSGGCDPRYSGFTKQVLFGSWQLKFNKERSLGNLGWDPCLIRGEGSCRDDFNYVGYMTEGNWQRCPSCPVVYYSGHAIIDGADIYLETGATASLYSYTPHRGQSFPGIFEGWFGPTTVPSNIPKFVWRLYNPSINNHFYTIYPEERDFATSRLGYRLEGPGFIGYQIQVTNTVPVYRLYSPNGRYHFYTTNIEEANLVINQLGYRWEGIGFYEHATGGGNRIPIYRLLHPGTGKHFFTGGISEANVLISQGWRFEGIAWYAQ